MNAYELSDYVADNGYIGTGTTHEVSIMLRQQADRIAELEKPHKYDPETGEPLIDGYPLFSGLPRPQTKTENTWTSCSACGQKVTEDLIHTCSPQLKPLSDEEIMDIAEQSDYSPLEIEMGYDYEIRIARAIEERHGIK